MNVHQLELFYHVVLHEGVTQAARALEREQPTVSRQINDLEDSLRVQLYHRRPFKLTEQGEVLFRGIERFFRELPRLEEQVKGGDTLRLGASPIVLMHHLPALEKKVRQQIPSLRLLLREATQIQLIQCLEKGEIDLAITLLPKQAPPKVFTERLLELPLVLLILKESPLLSAEPLWVQPEIRESLICLPPEEMICREFQMTLASRSLEWRPRIEVGSLSLVEHYVLEGYGIGLSVRIPGVPLSPKLRELDLPQFPAMPLGMMWRDNEDRLTRLFREQVRQRVVLVNAEGRLSAPDHLNPPHRPGQR
jgi:DNA-binding transcriptional LysR family regulator